MAPSKSFVLLLCLFLVGHFVESHRLLQSLEMTKEGAEGSLVNVSAAVGLNCGGLCTVRCSQSSRPNLCKRACGTCCARCSCVPPGTFGNYDACPCYASMTTHGGARKCP
ncbi:gibberellin-regulated protein 1-like [Iris pallida]|uniref:Gibberellin-regulated protein 1-like n=1 Tax=Iris pallida TaxID=29817 RepID=A0AAX6E231_IRIPA|nr:gibberellin-regulated protein 1-like [Iris pallida]